jgi:chromosome partitioning protein
METLSKNCSVCSVRFDVHFSYQLESWEQPNSSGEGVRYEAAYCSQSCLERSHRDRSDGLVACNACAKRFKVELAAQIVFTGGRRHYACDAACRARVLEGARAVRLGELLATPAPAAVEPVPAPAPAAARPVPPPLPSPRAAVAAVQAQTPPSPAVAVPLTPAPPSVTQATQKGPAISPLLGTRPKVLAVFNHKGGTAKTTTAVHVAAGLAARGQRVLLVDTDGQGNVATSLGVGFERSLYHVIVMRLPYREAITVARPNLDLVPADETLAAAELYLAGQKQRDKVLQGRFAEARGQYDAVVVDCSPSLSLLNQNALVMADAVLCPVACDYLSLIGVRQVVRTVKQVNRLLSHRIGFWGVLPTFFDSRARVCHDALDALREHFGDVCLDPIRFTSRVKEAPSQGKTLFEYAPTSTAADDYSKVVERLLGEPKSQYNPDRSMGEVA